MSKSKVINDIKILLGMEVKFEQMKLENGTTIEAESFEVGWDVFIISEDGEKVPTPDGEYILEDGRILIAKDGVIMSINVAEEQKEVVEEEEMKEEKEVKKVVESATKETHFSAEQLTELETMLEVMFEKHLASVGEKESEKETNADGEKKDVKKEEMTKEIKHSAEKKVKVFNQNRKKERSVRQAILSKMNNINN